MTAEQIKALNEMITACIENGGDVGGAYFSCEEKCIASIENFLNTMNVALYEIKKDEFDWPYVVM